MRWEDGSVRSALTVNLNTSGLYVADVALPRLGSTVRCEFGIQDEEQPMIIEGLVIWLNPRQQHPIHSLPPGYALKFELSEKDLPRIEKLIERYRNDPPQSR